MFIRIIFKYYTTAGTNFNINTLRSTFIKLFSYSHKWIIYAIFAHFPTVINNSACTSAYTVTCNLCFWFTWLLSENALAIFFDYNIASRIRGSEGLNHIGNMHTFGTWINNNNHNSLFMWIATAYNVVKSYCAFALV